MNNMYPIGTKVYYLTSKFIISYGPISKVDTVNNKYVIHNEEVHKDDVSFLVYNPMLDIKKQRLEEAIANIEKKLKPLNLMLDDVNEDILINNTVKKDIYNSKTLELLRSEAECRFYRKNWKEREDIAELDEYIRDEFKHLNIKKMLTRCLGFVYMIGRHDITVKVLKKGNYFQVRWSCNKNVRPLK